MKKKTNNNTSNLNSFNKTTREGDVGLPKMGMSTPWVYLGKLKMTDWRIQCKDSTNPRSDYTWVTISRVWLVLKVQEWQPVMFPGTTRQALRGDDVLPAI
jgi:hypothetical protein